MATSPRIAALPQDPLPMPTRRCFLATATGALFGALGAAVVGRRAGAVDVPFLDEVQRQVETSSTLERDTAYARAFNLLTNPQTKRAFNLNEEPAKLRDGPAEGDEGTALCVVEELELE